MKKVLRDEQIKITKREPFNNSAFLSASVAVSNLKRAVATLNASSIAAINVDSAFGYLNNINSTIEKII